VIRLFSESNPISILLLFILGALIRIPYFISPDIPESFSDAGYLYGLLQPQLHRMSHFFGWISPASAYLLIFIQGLSLNGFINSHKLYGNTHSLFVFSYVLFTALVPQWNELSPFLFVNMLMMFVIPKFIDLFTKRNAQNDIFTLSVLISLSSLMYKPAVAYSLLLYIALLVLRPFKLSEWMIILIGFILPYYLILVYAYVWDHWEEAIHLIPSVKWHQPLLSRNPADLIALVFLLIPLLSGLFYVQKYIIRILAMQRKIWTINFYYLLMTVFIVLSVQNNGYDNFLLILLPGAFYITAFFYFPSVRFFPNVFSWLILGFLFVRNFL
jgi:hypothetical protein